MVSWRRLAIRWWPCMGEGEGEGEGNAAATAAHPEGAPASLGALFWAFTWLAMQGFGGVIAVAQRELCEHRRWLSNAEFLSLLATAQVLPGPDVCNLSLMVGDRFFGWRGACVALCGMLLAPMAVLLGLASLLTQLTTTVASQALLSHVLQAVAAAAAGQILGTALRLAQSLRSHVLGAWPAAAAAITTATWVVLGHASLASVLLILGGALCLGCWFKLRHHTPANTGVQ